MSADTSNQATCSGATKLHATGESNEMGIKIHDKPRG
jgi:hypothetical protein